MAVYLPIPGVDWRVLTVDGSGNPISTTNPLPVSATAGTSGGVVSTANSTTATLGGGATFTGTGEDVSGYALITVNVFADQIPATSGIKLQFSSDNTNWDTVTDDPGFDFAAASISHGLTFEVTPQAKFFRVRYTNGATPQTVFRLQTVYKGAGTQEGIKVYNATAGSFQYIRSANSLPQNFGGGTQPGLVACIRNAAGNHDLIVTAKQANTAADGVGVAATGVVTTSDAGTTWKALKGNADGSLPVGGFTGTVSATLTRAANQTPYSTGDEMTDVGTAILTLTGMARVSGGTGTIYEIGMICSSNSAAKPTLELWIFDTTSTPQTDNTAFAPSDGVAATVIPGGIVPLSTSFVGDPTSTTGNFVMTSGPLVIPYTCVGSANLYLRVVLRSAYTAGASSDTYIFRVGVAQD